jgi:outer membrane beta-barrel protein
MKKLKALSLISTLLFALFSLSSSVMAAEGDTYSFTWLDQDKEVYVLQNRKFRKKGRVYLNAGYGLTTSGAFVDANAVQLRAGFFPTEVLGVELVYSKNSGEENVTAASVRNDGSLAGSVPFRRITEGYIGGMLMWSPFYSKINTFNTIIYMDWLIGVGYAQLDEKNNRTEFLTGNLNSDSVTESHGGIMWDIGAKIYLNTSFSVRVDLTAIHYKAERPSVNGGQDDWNKNHDLMFSIEYNF